MNVLQNLRAVSLERSTEVVQFDARHLGHHPIGDARRQPPRDGVVHPNLAPSARNVITLVEFGEQGRDVFGRVLQVAIHRDHDLTGGLMEPGGKRGGLAEIPPQLHYFQVSVGFRQVGQQLETVVGRSVVDEDDLIRPPEAGQHRRELVIERKQGWLFVVNRDDDGNH